VILLVIAVGAVVLVAMAAAPDRQPARVSDATASTLAPATTTSTPTTVPPATTTTTPAAASEATAVAVASEVSVDDGEGPGLVITNSGSATADVGGNVVSGGAGGPSNVVTGDATAVGNTSSVRTP
jgi:hypothetical protein